VTQNVTNQTLSATVSNVNLGSGNSITAGTFVGALQGNADTATAASTAAESTKVNVANTTNSSADHSVLLSLDPSAADGQKSVSRSSAITFNTATNKLSCGTTGTANSAITLTGVTSAGYVRNELIGNVGGTPVYSLVAAALPTTITQNQADAIELNTHKTGITTTQAGHITANNAKPTTSTMNALVATTNSSITALTSVVTTNATKFVHVYNSGFQTSSTNKNFWIPFRGTGEVANSSANNPLNKMEQCTFIAPYAGVVKKILFRCETTMSNLQLPEASFKLCKANTNIELPSLTNQVGTTYSSQSIRSRGRWCGPVENNARTGGTIQEYYVSIGGVQYPSQHMKENNFYSKLLESFHYNLYDSHSVSFSPLEWEDETGITETNGINGAFAIGLDLETVRNTGDKILSGLRTTSSVVQPHFLFDSAPLAPMTMTHIAHFDVLARVDPVTKLIQISS